MENNITVCAITLLCCGAMYFLGAESKEIIIGAIGVLGGYLTGKAKL